MQDCSISIAVEILQSCTNPSISVIHICPLQKPLRRVQIEEIGNDRDEAQRRAVQEIKSSQSQATKDITARDEELFQRLAGKDKPADSTQAVSPPQGQGQEDLKINLSEVTEEDTKVKITKEPSSESQKHSVKSPPSSTSSTPTTSPRMPPVPTTSFQFQTDWQSLKNHPEKFYQYFKVHFYRYNFFGISLFY